MKHYRTSCPPIWNTFFLFIMSLREAVMDFIFPDLFRIALMCASKHTKCICLYIAALGKRCPVYEDCTQLECRSSVSIA